MTFSVRKLTDNIGAEITGLDLTRPLDAKTLAEVRAVWLDHVVVVVPGQVIDEFDATRHKRRLHRTTVAGTGPTL